jgi:hypothetical protein
MHAVGDATGVHVRALVRPGLDAEVGMPIRRLPLAAFVFYIKNCLKID